MFKSNLNIKVYGVVGETYTSLNTVDISVKSATGVGLDVSVNRVNNDTYQIEFSSSEKEYKITVIAEGFVSQVRYYNWHNSLSNQVFVLLEANASFLYQNEAIIPCTILEDSIGLIVESTSKSAIESVNSDLNSQGLIEHPDGYSRVYQSVQETPDYSAIINALRANNYISYCGFAVLCGSVVKIATGHLIVKFLDSIDADDVDSKGQLLVDNNQECTAYERISSHRISLRTLLNASPELTDLAQRINDETFVAFSYPQYVSVAETTAIIPGDFMYSEDFAFATTNLPDAFQKLQDAFAADNKRSLGGNIKFGASTIVTAIMDTGIKSENGLVINPELNGVVSKSSTTLQSNATGGAQSYVDIIDIGTNDIKDDNKNVIGSNAYIKGDKASIGPFGGIHETLEIIDITSPSPGVKRLHFSTNISNSYSSGVIVDINREQKIRALYNITGAAYVNNGSAYPQDNDDLNPVIDTSYPTIHLESDHGTAVAGIVAAAINNPSPSGTTKYGMSGVAANTRLIGLVHPSLDEWYARSFEFIAGIDANADPNELYQATFPSMNEPYADIVNCSLGLDKGLNPIHPRLQLAIDRATARGRNGRGMSFFVSSANDGQELGSTAADNAGLYYSVARYEKVFMIGSSDDTDHRTSTSNYGVDLEFCAPGSRIPATTINGQGGGVSFPLFKRTLVGPKDAGTSTLSPINMASGTLYKLIPNSTTIELDSVEGIAQDTWLHITNTVNGAKEDLYILSVAGPPTNTLTVTSDNPNYKLMTGSNPGMLSGVHPVEHTSDSAVKTEVVFDCKLLGRLTSVASNADTTITIDSSSNPNVSAGMELFIGEPVAGNPVSALLWRREKVKVTGPAVANGAHWDIPITAIGSAGPGYPIATTEVILSYANVNSGFGGTSAASPFAAGIAALVLSAKPTLTWVELRQILRDNAKKVGGYTYTSGHSIELGYGILDAAMSVEKALAYEHSQRDLIIRNNLTDDGISDFDSVESPDIWIRNLTTDDAVMNSAILNPSLLPYSKQPPHHNPYDGKNRIVYARIHNNGDTYDNLDCWIRFYLASSTGTPNSGDSTLFSWPDAWPIPETAPTTYSTTITNFIGEVKIPAGAIAPGMEKIVQMPWLAGMQPMLDPSTLVPTSGGDVYVLVEITPHDGLNVGSSVSSNNNISYRKLEFASDIPPTASFYDSTGDNPLPRIILVSGSAGVPVSTDFQFEIHDYEPFIHQETEVLATRTLEDGSTEGITWTYNGSTWMSVPASPTWMSLSNTVSQVSGNALGNPSSILFTGSFDLTSAYESVEFKVKLTYDQNDTSGTLQTGLISETTFHADTLVGFVPSGVGVQEFAKPSLHIFADLDNISPNPVQTKAQSFGPSDGAETTKFRVTSSFTSTQPVKALAAVTGTVAIQKENSDRINLILRPLIQSNIDLTPVKYFIYRGLRRDNFIEASGNNMIPESTPGLSNFMQDLYDQHNDRYASAPPAPDLKTKALGWFPLQGGSLKLDSLFFTTDPDFALPVVAKGTELGEFFIDAGYEFGLEIVLEEGEDELDLDYARLPYYEVDVNGISDPLLEKVKREEIRSFVDPAAYYGLHFDSGVKVPSTNAPLKQATLYTDFVSYFYTKNRLYLDIRSENGYSLNYYGNYDGDPGTLDEGKHVKLGFYGNNQILSYETNGWPILILDYDSVQNVEDLNQLTLRIKALDNNNPSMYLERGRLKSYFSRNWVTSNNLFTVADTPPRIWPSSAVSLQIPNIVDPGDPAKRLNVSSAYKAFWVRSKVPATWPQKVVRKETYTDNLFGPLDIDKLVTKKFIIPLKKVQWFELQGLRNLHLPGPMSGSVFPYMYQTGFAFDEVDGDDRVIFFATFSHTTSSKEQLQFADGVNNHESFFHTNYVFKGLRLVVDTIYEDLGGGSSQEVKILKMEIFPYSKLEVRDAMMIGLHKDEVDDLKGLGGFNTDIHDRFIKLEEVPSPGGPGVPFDDVTAGTPKQYFKYKVGVQGQDTNGNYLVSFPTPGNEIYVYTFDKYLFASKDFSANQSEIADIGLTYEESFIISRPQPNEILSLDATMLGHVTTFEAAIMAIADDEAASQNLKTLVGSSGTTIWTYAMSAIKNANYANPDSRQLYWGRLRMRIAIKEHPAVVKSRDLKNELLELFESKSRGYDAVNFTNSNPAFAGQGIDFNTVKKVIMSGFDPFELNPFDLNNAYGDNLSGALALGMHDTIIKDGSNQPVAIVQAAVFPVRYEDFDKNGGLGVIEDYFTNYITPGPDEVDLVLTTSRDTDPVLFLDRFAARVRAGGKDNNNMTSSDLGPGVPAAVTGANFIETSLDVTKFVPVDEISNNGIYPVFFNQNYKFTSPDGTVNRYEASLDPSAFQAPSTYEFIHGHDKIEDIPSPDIEGVVPSDLSVEDLKLVSVEFGSGGKYLSNETFYRVSALREKLNSGLSTGHLHLPHYQSLEEVDQDDYDATKSSASLNFIIDIIKNAVQ